MRACADAQPWGTVAMTPSSGHLYNLAEAICWLQVLTFVYRSCSAVLAVGLMAIGTDAADA